MPDRFEEPPGPPPGLRSIARGDALHTPDNDRFQWILQAIRGPENSLNELDSLRATFRGVLRWADRDELDRLARAQIQAADPLSLILGLETLQHASPGSRLRPDDEDEALQTRQQLLRSYSTDHRALVGATRCCPPELRGDLMLLCCAHGTPDPMRLLVRHVYSDETWSGCAARIIFEEAQGQPSASSPRQGAFEAGLADALDHWKAHRNPLILSAAVVYLASLDHGGLHEGPLRTCLADEQSAGCRALHGYVASAQDQHVRTRLLRLVGHSHLHRSAIHALESSSPSVLATACEAASHLLRTPRRKHALGRSRIATRLAGRLLQGPMPPRSVLRVAPELLVSGLRKQDTLAHRLGVIALAGDRMSSVLAIDALRRVPRCPEHDHAMADIERGNLSVSVQFGPSTATSLTVFDAQSSLALFETALATKPPWWCAACSVGHARDRSDALYALLRRVLRGSCGRSQAAACEVIARRHLVAHFEQDLIDLVSSDHSQLDGASGAQVIRLLAEGPTGRSAKAILRALASTDVAMQAAALEATANPRASEAVRAGTQLIDVHLLERLARSPGASIRRPALIALRARAPHRFETVVAALLEGKSSEGRLAGIEAARYSENASLRSAVLRALEETPSPRLVTQGRSALRFLRARQVSIRRPEREQVG